MGRKRFQIMALCMAGSMLFTACGKEKAADKEETASVSDTKDSKNSAEGSDTK